MRRAEDYFNTCKRHWCFWAIIILIPIVQSSNNTFVIIRGSEDSFTATRPDGCQHSIATRTKSNRDVFHCKCDHGTYFYQQELKTTCVKNDQLAILQGCKTMVNVPKMQHSSIKARSCVVTLAGIYNATDTNRNSVWSTVHSEKMKKMFTTDQTVIKVQNNHYLEGLLVKIVLKCALKSDCYLYKFFGQRTHPLDHNLSLPNQSKKPPHPPHPPPPPPRKKNENKKSLKTPLVTVLLPIVFTIFAIIFILMCLLRKRRIALKKLVKKQKNVPPEDSVPTIVIEDYDSIRRTSKTSQKDATKDIVKVNSKEKKKNVKNSKDPIILVNKNIGVTNA